MCTCTHMHLCAALWAHVEICMSGVFSTALHLRSFPLKRKLCAGLQAQLAWGDTVAEVWGTAESGGQSSGTQQWAAAGTVSQKPPIHWGRAYSSQLRAAWRTSQVRDSRLELLLPSSLPGSHSAVRIWLCQSLSFILGKERNLESDRNQELGLWIQILLILCECPFHC